MNRSGFLGGALVLCALSIAACNGDDSTPVSGDDAGQDSGPPPGDDASATDSGRDASVPVESGTDATVPADGETDGEALVDGGADSSPGDASGDTGGDAGPDGGPHDGGDASTPSYALFVGTDFVNAELAVVALHPDSVAGQLPLADQDSVPSASGGAGFVLERGIGKVVVLDHAQPWTAKATIDVNDMPDAAPPYGANPHAIVLTMGTKAYVARYASNVVSIVDVASGAVTGSLDLSAFMAPDDTDGLVDVQDAAFDPGSGRAYFLLERINQNDYGQAPDYVAACLASHAEIVGVDVSTNAIVDLNGTAAGTAIDLLGDNPAELTPDFADGRLIVPDTGCYQSPASDAGDGGPAPRVGRGIEAVALSTGTPTWLYQTSDLDRVSGVIWVDGTHAFVNKGSDWFAWNPTQTSLGSDVAGFPQAPFYDGTGRIVGLSFGAPPDAGPEAGTTWSVVAWDVATSQLATIAGNPFHSVIPATGYGVASALLH